MKLSRTVRVTCYMQLALVLMVLFLGVRLYQQQVESKRLVDKVSPQYVEFISILKREGIPHENREYAATLFEGQLSCVVDAPELLQSFLQAALACAVALALLPVILLLESRASKSDEPGTA